MTADLDESLSGHAYFRRLIRNMVEWSIQNPGLHRFISSDPIDPDHLPSDIVETVVQMKRWVVRVLQTLAPERLEGERFASLVDITLGYLDGEVFNLINGRVLPGEDVAGRIVDNAERLFALLTARYHDGIFLSELAAAPGRIRFPELHVT
jgi:hypothetical protein